MWRDSAGIGQSWDSSEKALIQCTSWGQAQHQHSGPNTEWFLSPKKKPLKTQRCLRPCSGWIYTKVPCPPKTPCPLLSDFCSRFTVDSIPCPTGRSSRPFPCFCPKQNLQRKLLNYFFTIRIISYFRNLAGSVSEPMLRVIFFQNRWAVSVG